MAAIVAATRSLTVSRTFKEVTGADIVGAAELAKGAFYHHLASKTALLEYLVDRVQAEIAAELQALPQGTSPSTPERLAGALEMYLRSATTPDRVQILLRDGPAQGVHTELW